MLDDVAEYNTVADWELPTDVCPTSDNVKDFKLSQLQDCAAAAPEISFDSSWPGASVAPAFIDNWVGLCPSDTYVTDIEADTGEDFNWET